MAGTEMKDALRSAADGIAKFMDNMATLTVETRTTDIANPGDEKGALGARTTIRLDGDNTLVLPCRKNEDGRPEVDSAIYDIHVQNVQAAIEYRARMLSSVLELLKGKS